MLQSHGTENDFQFLMSTRAVMRLVRYGTIHIAMLARFMWKIRERKCVNCRRAYTSGARARARARISRKNFVHYAYAHFDFRLDVREPGSIHPRCDRIVVIRMILDLHDSLTARGEKEKDENTIPGPHRFTPANDITRPPTSFPVAAHSLSPTAICRICKNRRFPLPPRIFTTLRSRRNEALRATGNPHETRRSRRRVLRAMLSWTRVIEGKPRERNEAKRGRDPTGAGGPRMPRGPASSDTSAEWGG